ncbi:MAG: TM1802 family CRISPR-associated protein [Eubacteriaceae bacterium]
MSLPKLTSMIGNYIVSNPMDAIIKNVTLNDKKENFIVFLVFDLKKEEIYFELDKKMNDKSVYEYFYFGNKRGNGPQFYLTREIGSLNYLLQSAFSDLYSLLKNNEMDKQELASLIGLLNKKGMVYLSDKQGQGQINLNKFSILSENPNNKIRCKNKNIIINEEKYNYDQFIRLFIQDANKNNKYTLIVPKIIQDDEEIILSKHVDYLKLVKIVNEFDQSEVEKNNSEKTCYICKQKKPDVSSKYSKNLSTSGINKIFVTTTKNYASNFGNYDNNFSVCKQCYQKLKSGEKVVSNQFRGTIAGENVFIIPEGLMESFDYKYLSSLKETVDLAFNREDLNKWINEIEDESNISNLKQYSVNYIFYKTDGNSISIIKTIEEVTMIRLIKIMNTFRNNSLNNELYSTVLTLGLIYKMIPVKTNKKKEQLDIGRVLSFYKALLMKEKIKSDILFDYACEALEKGCKQLSKTRIDNFYNMGLSDYIGGKEDFFIKNQVFSYITLMKSCQDLGLLEENIFKFEERIDENMNNIETPVEEINTFIREIEKFLDNRGFAQNAKALFYLGMLINRVAFAQVQKNHKKKPILNRIQFNGINSKEVLNLYNDVLEKLIQYNKMTIFTEAILNRFHEYYDYKNVLKVFTDRENVFYIMAGYSYLVGKKILYTTDDENNTI